LTPHTSKSTTSTQMDADHQKTGSKILDLHNRKTGTKPSTPKKITTTPAATTQSEGEVGVQDKTYLCTACFTRDTYHRTRDCPIFLESKKKMTQKKNQHLNPSTAKEINHTSHWHQTSQSSSSHQPLYQHSNTRSEYQSNYHIYPSPYNYTSHTSQAHTA
jgi:hypothetical protein